MRAWRLGDIEKFPFLEPPDPGPQPPTFELTGMWLGTWSSAQVPNNGLVSAELQQVDQDLSGALEVGSSACFRDGSVTGVFTTDRTIQLLAAFDGSDIVFDGEVRANGNQVAGTYRIVSGACAGDSGSWSMAAVATTVHIGVFDHGDGEFSLQPVQPVDPASIR